MVSSSLDALPNARDEYYVSLGDDRNCVHRYFAVARALVLGLLVIVAICGISSTAVGGVSPDDLSAIKFTTHNHSAFVHLFEWDWPSVAKECETWLAPKGFDAVQISPVQESIQGHQWWSRYQPVSFKLISRSGDEEQLIDMIRRCSAVGVKVIIDVVMNQMAAGAGTGTAGSQFESRVFPEAELGYEDFHHLASDPTANCGVNFSDVHNIQFCDLVGMPDLCTECSWTRRKLAAFLQKLSSYGDVGFRIDAATHQDSHDLGLLLEHAGSPWNFQEVMHANWIPISPNWYVNNGLVTEFQYIGKLAPLFLGEGDKFRSLDTTWQHWGWIPSESAVIFADNHDTQRNAWGIINYKAGEIYFLFVIYTLAVPYGYPKVLSSYEFTDYNQGPPAYPAMTCASGWRCEHRRPEIANMVAWRRAAGRHGFDNVLKDESGDHIAFSRGGVAFIALNRGDTDWVVTVQTGLPAGRYCNIIVSSDPSVCPIVEVAINGEASISVKPVKAVAIHGT